MADDKRQGLFVPITGGLGTDADPRMRAPERLEIARNVRSPEIGTLGKRYGFSVLSDFIAGTGGASSIGDNGPVRGLMATNKELLAVGHRNLYAYGTSLAGWVDRGSISPCLGDTQEAYRANVQYDQADADRSGNYILQAAIRREGWGDATDRLAMEFRCKDVSGDTVFTPTIEERTSVTADQPYAVRVAAHATGGVILWAQGDTGGVSNNLKRYEWDNTNPSAAPTLIAGSITADLYVRSNTRTFDGIESGGGYCVAYIDETNQDIILNVYDTSHSLSFTQTITGTFYAVALAEAGADGHFYVLAVSDEEADLIVLYHRTNALVAVWGPRTLSTLAAADTADNLGVNAGSDGTEERAACVWSIKQAGTYRHDMGSRSNNHDDDLLDTEITTYNVNPLARPFWYRERAYVHAGSVSEVAYAALGFESHMLFDLAAGVASRAIDDVRLAALWGVGAANGRTNAFNLGSNNNVWVMDDAVTYRMMCPFLGEVIKAETTTDLEFADIRMAFDDVGFEFDAAPGAAPLHRGAAIIGGGYVSWYDGARAFELGFARPPFISSLTQAAGTIPNATYTYSSVWQHVDASGILHRSLPSPSQQEALADVGGTTDVTCIAESLPGSLRPIQDVTCQWFRAGGDNVPKRVNRSDDNVPNTLSAAVTQALTDDYVDARLYVPQYTVGGVLEAVAPEGARIPHVARERLWLGDFFRGDRIQYSKLVVPSTAGETAIAPELYEALGRISGDGQAITGITDMDSTTVVFTERKIYLVAGYGPDPRGVGDDTSRLTEVPSDAGCIEPRSVVSGPDGVYFQTDRGIYLLGRNHEVSPIGEPVRTLMDTYSVVTSAVVVTKERQIRFTVTNSTGSDGRILVYDYRIGAWFEWHILTTADATLVPSGGAFIDSTYYISNAIDDKVYYEDETTWYDNTDVWITMTTQIGAIQPAGPLHWFAAWEFGIMAEYKDDHSLVVNFYNDHSDTASTTKTYTDEQLQALNDEANYMHLLITPDYPKCESVSVRINDAENGSPTTGRGFEIHGIGVEVQIYGGLPRLPKEARQ